MPIFVAAAQALKPFAEIAVAIELIFIAAVRTPIPVASPVAIGPIQEKLSPKNFTRLITGGITILIAPNAPLITLPAICNTPGIALPNASISGFAELNTFEKTGISVSKAASIFGIAFSTMFETIGMRIFPTRILNVSKTCFILSSLPCKLSVDLSKAFEVAFAAPAIASVFSTQFSV